MERTRFECPATGETVDIGLESDLNTLLRLRGKAVEAPCPACGRRHSWRIADAKLLPRAA